MIPFLSILSNPLTRVITDKIVNGASAHLERKQAERSAKLEATKSVEFAEVEKAKQIALAKAQVAKAEAGVRKAQVSDLDKTIRDEVLVFTLCGLLVANFLPFTAPYMERGWELVDKMPEFIEWSFLAVIGGTFGLNLTSKIKK
tara:strand:- start:418 stop:849 length:432 start_codon:yes stop_codon:yes gene_type:complete